MKSKYIINPGNELRGFKIRLYPTQEQINLLSILEDDCRYVWNWLVSQTEQVINARQAYAIRNNLVPTKPAHPIYDGLEPEQAKKAKEKYIDKCTEWHNLVHQTTNKVPECSYRKLKDTLIHFGHKQDYQLFTQVIGWRYQDHDISLERKIKPCAHMLQSLCKNFFQKSDRRKKFRKKSDAMPLQVRSHDCFELGSFGKRGNNEQFYNCQIKINGLKIRGRLPGKLPTGRILEGVSLRYEGDGWYASIKEEVPIRQLATPIPGTVIGIDVGLDLIAAMSDGTRIENPRGKEHSNKIAERQAKDLPAGKLQAKAARHTLHLIYNQIIKPLATTETIKVEKLSKTIGQMGSRKISVMRKITFLLKQRYGDRVREVECHYTSQDCSQCGERSKESWSYVHGRYGECPKCGFKSDRDVNAARNIARKAA